MPGVWHFYVGFRSLPQKNCTIWTLSKGYGIWIAPYALSFLYRQIVQPKPKTKNYIGNVMAKLHLRFFAMPFFISSLLYTILADLRSFLKRNKWGLWKNRVDGLYFPQPPHFLIRRSVTSLKKHIPPPYPHEKRAFLLYAAMAALFLLFLNL